MRKTLGPKNCHIFGGMSNSNLSAHFGPGRQATTSPKKAAKKSSKQSFNSFFYNSHKFNSSSGFAKNTDSWNILQTCAEKPTSSGENRCNTAATWFFSFKIWNTEKNICWKNPVWTCSIQTIVVKKPKFRLCQMPNSRKAIPTTTSI